MKRSPVESETRVRVVYPLPPQCKARIVLRTDADWDRDLEPARIADGGNAHEFTVELAPGFRYFKPLLVDESGPRWSQGDDYLVLDGARAPKVVHPHFSPDSKCHVCDLHAVPAHFAERVHSVRVWLPPGYDENELARYPVLYMQDGQNLFFAGEAFGGKPWQVDGTLKVLEAMNLVRRVIVVGIYPIERERDYTAPGYADYGRFLVEDLVPWVNANYRTLATPEHTAVMGSSLGGVVSLHLAFAHPDVFGKAACLSSTFGYRDDLFERVAAREKLPLELYLDSGWPHDNFEVTRRMHNLLQRSGWIAGVDLFYLAFPRAVHDEAHWAMRAHIPFQLLFGDETRGGATHPSR